jgi:sec-independent protein translocase protein TatC
MKIRKKPTTSHGRTALPKDKVAVKPTQPFIEHLHELRRRIYYIAASVLVWGAATYAIQQHVVNALIRPAHGQHFIYTSVGGGIDFLFRVCIYTGLILSTPIIVYNLLEFVSPLMSRASRRFIIFSSLTCGTLALAGVAFGYFIGLPAALHFLFHQFTTAQIKPLVTIQAYLSFVIAYMLGSALLFQLPILLVSINRIKPLKPSSLLRYERWVILAAFVLAGLMNPTPNLFSQLLVAGPFILMYQVGILLIALINRSRSSVQNPTLDISEDKLTQLLQDQEQPLETLSNLAAPVQAAVPQAKLATRRSMGDIQRQRPARPSIDYARRAVTSRPAVQVPAIRRQRFMDFMPPAAANSQSLAPEL